MNASPPIPTRASVTHPSGLVAVPMRDVLGGYKVLDAAGALAGYIWVRDNKDRLTYQRIADQPRDTDYVSVRYALDDFHAGDAGRRLS